MSFSELLADVLALILIGLLNQGDNPDQGGDDTYGAGVLPAEPMGMPVDYNYAIDAPIDPPIDMSMDALDYMDVV